ncbi:hypothetical protein LFT45_18605 [Arthrobacter sp. FW305-BF8]|uniref:hypothetical protein n=1 Tax=Arthrobacter sp. FW305-BF8 TaxID=2879617 RepID=UPI001F1A323C|nr:hypothetical protein [Arthrobacter sp. FW305-BF8]UKA53699.1 hypothetical protein LFT45_18605 [Arthrobacter sp. FW305-BF8]
MNQQSQGQPGPARQDPAQPGQGQAPLGAGPSGRPEAHNAAPTFMKQQGVRNEAVAGPFTVRDLTVFAAALVLFIASLIPMFAVRYNLWNLGSLFFLGLGVVLPLIVAALFVARRLAPDTKVRIGSLSVDQFGSVVASFAVAFFFLSVAGAYTPSLLVGLIGSLVLLAATVLARFIPFFAGDFLDRSDVPAHVMARDSAVPVRKPKAPKEPKAAASTPAAAKPGTSSAGASAGAASAAVFPGSVTGASAGPESRGHVSHGATAVGQQGQGAAQAGTAGAVIPGATAPIAGAAGAAGAAGVAPAAGTWPAANAASSAAASPETGQAAVVQAGAEPSAQTGGVAAQTAAVPSAKAAGADVQPATPEAEQTRPDAATVPPAAGAGAASQKAPAADAPVAEAKPDAAARQAEAARAAEAAREAEAARAASATPATAVHPRVDVQQQVRSQEPIGATVDPASRPEESEQEQVHEAFWFAVAQHRTAVDERTGAPLFGIEPGGWVLALEDRGDEFLVQHTDGRVGVLRDLSNIERG